VFGAGGGTSSYEEIENTDLIVLWGSNARETHPIFFHHVLKGIRKGARLVVVDPRRTTSAQWADLWLGIDVGSDIALSNTMAREIIAAGRNQLLRSTLPGLGADVVMEAVGVPETFELCTEMVRPGGHVANIGVHGKAATLHLESLWIKDVTITTGLVDTSSTPRLLDLVRRLSGSERDAARTHLVSLFELVGNQDDRVAKARTALANALF